MAHEYLGDFPIKIKVAMIKKIPDVAISGICSFHTPKNVVAKDITETIPANLRVCSLERSTSSLASRICMYSLMRVGSSR